MEAMEAEEAKEAKEEEEEEEEQEEEGEEEVRGWSRGRAGLQFLSRTPVGPTLFLSLSSLSPLYAPASLAPGISSSFSVLPPHLSLSCLPMGLSLPQPSDTEDAG